MDIAGYEGEAGNVMDGGPGDDIIGGGHGPDTITGGDGVDNIRGGQADDLIDGGDGNDAIQTISGGNSNGHYCSLGNETGHDTILPEGGRLARSACVSAVL